MFVSCSFAHKPFSVIPGSKASCMERTPASQTSIEACIRISSSFEFIAGDFLKLDFTQEYDLVISHAVVDHVYDMDAFVSKIVKLTKQFAYITAYRGYFPELKKHKMNWNHEDGSYYNDFSIIQIKEKFKEKFYEIDALQEISKIQSDIQNRLKNA